jgi:hypothetical protein
MTRSHFLRVHIEEIMNIIRSDVPLIGYLHWSLFDNDEWGTFTPDSASIRSTTGLAMSGWSRTISATVRRSLMRS